MFYSSIAIFPCHPNFFGFSDGLLACSWLSELHRDYFYVAAVPLAFGTPMPCTQVRAVSDSGDDVSQLCCHAPRFQLLCTRSTSSGNSLTFLSCPQALEYFHVDSVRYLVAGVSLPALHSASIHQLAIHVFSESLDKIGINLMIEHILTGPPSW